MTNWISTEIDNPKPSDERFYLISDGTNVSLGKFEPLGEGSWIDSIDKIECYLGCKKEVGRITHWASLPLPPDIENE